MTRANAPSAAPPAATPPPSAPVDAPVDAPAGAPRGGRAPGVPYGVTERLLTVDDVLRLSEAGAFADTEHVELIDGRLVVGPADGIQHTRGGAGVSMALTPLVAGDPRLGALAVVATPTLRVSEARALAPDYAVVERAALQRDALMSAADVALAVEVAVSSLAYDDGAKKRLYAEAGLAELWIVRMAFRDVRVCRAPSAEGGWGYERLAAAGETVAPLFAPDAAIPVAALLGQA